MALLLAAVTVAVNAALVLAVAPGAQAGTLTDPSAAAFGDLLRPLALFAGLTVLAGWAGLLLTSLLRSGGGGPAGAVRGARSARTGARPAAAPQRAGAGRPRPAELLPFQYGLDLVRGVDPQRLGAAPALDGAFVAAVLASARPAPGRAVLAQLRRRAL
ncbi:hypothetical protein GCM10020229_45940 [Kitasatospora albolonga]|uniref:hypothetical protein n=1 Tax=Kitasatospora albolonga TaxID=68173 RepID=UPI0031E91889